MQLLDEYNKIEEQIFEYFGFKMDWKVFPIEDNRKYYWEIDGEEIRMYDTHEAYEEQDDSQTYVSFILKHRFYEKSVYEGKEYTMILVDTNTDGNQFLSIYDNSKKV